MIFLKQALTESAYQGVLVAMKPNATEADITTRVQSILDARNIKQTSIHRERQLRWSDCRRCLYSTRRCAECRATESVRRSSLG